jgi:hypothetical protein
MLKRWVMLVVGTVAALGALFLVFEFRSAAPREFRECFGFDVDGNVVDLCMYSDLRTVDPAYFYRFRASPQTKERLIRALPVAMDGVARSAIDDRRLYRGEMPAWWKPEEIQCPQTWTWDDGRLIRRLRIDRDGDLVYVELLFF